MTRTKSPLPLQEIQDAQGSVIFVERHRRFKVGDVISGVRQGGSFHRNFECSVVVVGVATKEEYQQQCRRFGLYCPDVHPDYFTSEFYKVVAE